MTICKGYVRVFWMLQLLTYSSFGLLFYFFFPQHAFPIVAWSFTMIVSAGLAATGTVREILSGSKIKI